MYTHAHTQNPPLCEKNPKESAKIMREQNGPQDVLKRKKKQLKK